MKIQFDNLGQRYSCDLSSGVSLARPITFEGSESNPWHADAATKDSVTFEGFVGSTKAGGSCNVDRLTVIPHCHGTHTETIGHLVDRDYFISKLSLPSLMPAIVVTALPVAAGSTAETYQPLLQREDMIVSEQQLSTAIKRYEDFVATALIVRTHSKDAFFSNEAMATIADAGFEHLLIDLPSVDRLNDDGILSNHRIFWNLELGCREVTSSSRVTHTITELIQVPDKIDDGPCLLSIQVPSIESDAAPSKPILYSITQL